MRVRDTNEAIEEISDILDHIANDNPTAADEVSRAIEDTISLLRRQPLIARIVYKERVRAFPVGDYPYRIFYQSWQAEIVIRNVRHTRRQMPWDGKGSIGV